MDHLRLAELLFPQITTLPEDIEKRYPPRDLPKGAKVTRMAPSPTGFMHLGNLYGALVDERLAHQSGGVFYLRIEDTDQKREVEGAVELILSVFRRFGLPFDEGASADGETGAYGPYRQRQRAEIYQTFAKELVRQGKAYPCFCTEEELEEMRRRQEAEKANFGYYGKWAVWRDASMEEIEKKLREGVPYVLRFRSPGSCDNRIHPKDLIKGEMELPENDQDTVLLKSDGIPTYHFAHVVDDHLMGTTHVVRGEEWLATWPIHLQLFEALGWRKPNYLHTAHMLKMDGASKRKLSKRKDPELSLDYYHTQGYPVEAVLEYLMTVLNSNYEEWRLKNPTADRRDFPFKIEKMSASGALFDMDKLRDISKNTIAVMDAETVYAQTEQWSRDNDPDFHRLLAERPDYAQAILAIGRGGPKPRKDIALWSEVKDYMGFFYDELFQPAGAEIYPANLTREDWLTVLDRYGEIYSDADDSNQWFERVKGLSEQMGLAPETKLFKKNPGAYRGHVGDVSMVLRIAMTGRTNSPDLYTVMKILGKDRVLARLKAAACVLRG